MHVDVTFFSCSTLKSRLVIPQAHDNTEMKRLVFAFLH